MRATETSKSAPARPGPTGSPITPVRGFAIAVGLALGIAVGNGLARFAYALILPAMRADLGWSYTQAGSLNTTNAVGYLVGSALALATVRQGGVKRQFVAGLWLTVAALLATGLARDFLVLSGLRVLAGIANAYVLVAGSVLAASVFAGDQRRAAAAIAIYFGGGGAGMLLAGAVLPSLFAEGGDRVWPEAWLLLGAVAAGASVIATVAAGPVTAPAAGAGAGTWSRRAFLPLALAYGCFALGYFAYMTFIVAWMREAGATPSEITVTWCTLGAANLASPLIWGRAITRWTGGRAMAGVLAAIGVGAALPLAGASLPLMLVSVTLFGSFFMAPAAITAFVKRVLPPAAWGEAIAAFTLVFAALQCLGPVLTGLLADATGDLRAGLAASAAILLLGAGIACLQQERS